MKTLNNPDRLIRAKFVKAVSAYLRGGKIDE